MYTSIEEENDTAKLFSNTRKLLGWKQVGGPSCLKKDGMTLRKQKEVADCQMEYYTSKIDKISKMLPQVNCDPLYLLRRQFRRWIPAGGVPEFRMKSVTQKEVAEMIRDLKKVMPMELINWMHSL